MTGTEPASLHFDDFYISNSGFNTTVPRGTTVVGPTVGFSFDGTQLTLTWPSGVLEAADAVDGNYQEVPDASAPSYTVVPSAAQKFYRVSQ